MADEPARTAVARWRGLVSLAARRTTTRVFRAESGQTTLSIVGVGTAVALMLIVTSIGVGLAQTPPLVDGGVDYTIEPAGGASSSVVDVGGARLGRVHPVSERLNAREDVTFATPVLTTLLRLQATDGTPQTVLAIGVIPPDSSKTVVGLPTDPLAPGDPYYGAGGYDGPWTGQAVVSAAAAERLNASSGDQLVHGGSAAGNRSFTVTTVSAARRAGLGQFPVVLVHLSELQAVTGGADDDVADRILVDATADIEGELAGIYPRSTVLTRGELFGAGGSEGSQLPLAISLASFIVAVAVGTLFLMTTMGFELAADRRERAVMAAIGLSRRSRLALVVLQALVVAGLGGLLGIGLWLVGLVATNAVATTYLTDVPIAAFRPVFAVYGLGVAFLIGLLTLPYLLVVSRRAATAESLPV